MRKLVTFAFALMLCLAIALPGFAATVNMPDSRLVPEDETAELTIFQPLATNVEALDAETNSMTAAIEEATGLKLNFITASGADAATKLNALMSSGDYPDIISTSMANNLVTRSSMDYYATQGVLVPLDEYLTEEIAPNAYKIFSENAAALAVCTASDGHIYSLPDINECYHCRYGNGRAWYYMPWMDQWKDEYNNGNLPQTTAEFKSYLEWIRDNDVNGNGDPSDEVPLAFYSGQADSFVRWVADSFMVYTVDGYRLNEDGTITANFVEDAYKDALAYAHELYSEGLLLADSFTLAQNELQAIGESEYPTTAVIVGWGPEDGVVRGGETNRWYDYFALTPLEGPTGVRYANNSGSTNFAGVGFFVTDACEDVELAVRFGDLLLDYYWSLSTLLGPKDAAWGDPESEDSLGFDGQPANFRYLEIPAEATTNTFWNQQCITNRPSSFWDNREATGSEVIHAYLDGDYSLKDEVMTYSSYNEVMKYYACQKNLAPYAFDESYCVPSLLYSQDVTDLVADAEALVNSYRKEMQAAFITGTRSLDEYDAYVQEMYNYGLQDILDAKNDAYQNYLAGTAE